MQKNKKLYPGRINKLYFVICGDHINNLQLDKQEIQADNILNCSSFAIEYFVYK
jgi:hypothetical protein